MNAHRSPWLRALWLMLGVATLAQAALGQGSSHTEYRNTWFPRSTTKTTLTPTSTSGFGGSDYNPSSSTRSAPTNKTANLRVTQSRFGMTCGSTEANFFLGQTLPPPPGADTSITPEITGDGTNRVAWVGYARQLYAIDQGMVTVRWAMLNSTARSAVTYRVANYPAGRPVRLYWTEPPYNAPTVALPNAPILPTIYYNNQIANSSMVWLDSGNYLHATNNVRGQFLLTYSSKDEHGVEHLQGTEIVQVLEPLVSVQSVAIGQRLLPVSADEYGLDDLSARVIRGFMDQTTRDPATDFLYQHTEGRQNGWLYAIRKNTDPWKIEVYWLAKSLLDVVWPFEVDHYAVNWAPDTQLYVRGAPESGSRGPGVPFPASLSVELMSYQDPENHAVLQGQSLSTSQSGYCLLKYVQDREVAFDAVHSVFSTDPDYFDLFDWTWEIGRELAPEIARRHGAIDCRGGNVSVAGSDAFTTNIANARAITIEAWVAPRRTGSQTIALKGTGGYSLSIQTNRLCFTGGGTNNTVFYSTGLVPTNCWTHVAVAVQVGPPGSVRFYVDGFPGGETNASPVIASVADSSHQLTIGPQFDGGIDEVRVWAVALPAPTLALWLGRTLNSTHPYYNDLVGEFRFEEQAGSAAIGTGARGSYVGTLTGNIGWQSSGARYYSDSTATAAYRHWPGYLHSPTGDRYNVSLYRYPTTASFSPTASQIFPVNTGRLEVWWANQTRCGMDVPVYWPSLVNLYTNRWPAYPPAIVIASELGNESANLQSEGATCLRFDGAKNYLQAANSASLSVTNTFTIEAWVQPTSATAVLPIVSKGSDEYTLMLNASKLHFYDSTTAKSYYSDVGVPTNAWSHVAITYASGAQGLRFYINGQIVGTRDLPTTGLKTGTGPLYVGRRIAGSTYFAGLLDDVRLYNRVLTASDVRQSMYTTADRSDTDLCACYHFDAGDINDGTITDSSGYANAAVAVSAPGEWSPGVPWLQPGQSFDDQHPVVYYQNDLTLPGFNPNEEHAFTVGDRVYALRNDFNTAANPAYVLVQYSPPEIAPLQAMTVFTVLQSSPVYSLHKDILAGSMIQPPLPISLMSPANCLENYFTNITYQAAWTDRKHYTWARNAADDGTNAANITMKYYYPVQEGFYFPGFGTPPAPGTHIPWLSGANIDRVPIDYTYAVRWPDTAPVLNTVGTLIEARDGLPAIRGQKSVDILYQQSLARSGLKSVDLIDPTRARTAALTKVPDSIQSYIDLASGNTFFSDLPPDLRDRLYWNPNAPRGQELQLIGQYREMTDTRYNYLCLNLLASSNRAAVLSIPGASGVATWQTAIGSLPSDPVILTNDLTPFDSLALSAGQGKGVGYVTLVFNNSTNRTMVQDSDVIDVQVIRVDVPKYVGKLDLILSSNPLDQQLNIRYTADFAGHPELFQFQWFYMPGTSPNSTPVPYQPATAGLDYITVGDAGIFGLSDHWLTCQYRALDPQVQRVVGTNWSDLAPPVLAEGWIKRVLKAINPYEQRIKDFQRGLLTTLDMIAQAGPAYIGDVPLNLDALNQHGLIQIYQTVLNKGQKLSIESGVNDPDANLALILAAGRISDLYMLLGNEAYADALDPTIGLGTSDPVWGSMAPSIFSFMNQVPTLLDEELALLRGRDDSQSPPVDTYPVENRLFWNFTSDITGGEVAYALNYDIRDANGTLDGFINAEDAQALYPQGHGDAWGHYLTALQGYYSLLRNTNFVWIPQSEAVNVGTEAVGVSYLHEQRFCEAALAKARTGTLIVNNTYRNHYAGEGADTWSAMRDTDTNRCWGVAEWASRVGQGAYLDWLVANALLPAHDANPEHSGISLIDRQTVPELPEITAHYQDLQQSIDRADGGLNPLGLAHGVVPFDVSPTDLDSGQTHFEQIYARALEAWRTALAVFDHARFTAQALRNQAESQETLNQTVAEAEIDFTNRLLEIYGYPYTDDIGAGQIYPQGYQGPDLLHYNYIDLQDITGLADVGRMITVTVTNLTLVSEGELRELEHETEEVDFYVGTDGLQSKPPAYTGQRRAEGRIQIALKSYVHALASMRQALEDYHHLNNDIQTHFELLEQKSETFAEIITNLVDTEDYVHSNNQLILSAKALGVEAEVAAEAASKIGEAMAEEIPESIWEIFSLAHGLPKWAGAILYGVIGSTRTIWETLEKSGEVNNEEREKETEREITQMEHNIELEDDLAALRLLINAQLAKAQELQSMLAAADQARMEYSSIVAEGQRLQVARQTFRMHTAGPLQAKRYRNMAFRIFRNDALQRYTAAFDLAARYVYLAAKAYDYETALPVATDATLSGRNLMSQVVRARSLGRCSLVNETFDLPEPLIGGSTGDPGLADILARLKANWTVLKGRYGFNNPDTETGRFSLRTELFRIPPTSDSDDAWRTVLGRCYVTNLLAVPEFQRHCLPFGPMAATEPALVIPFQSTVEFGKNFFGLDLAGGDNAYDSSHFATKIRSVGVWFQNFNNAFDIATNGGGGLANMPRVYLIPVGLDIMRVPAGDTPRQRSWAVMDQALPVPYPLVDEDLMNPNWVPLQDSLSGGFGTMRKHPALRAYHDAGFDPTEMTYSSRLIGRSVWNTQWLLIIPGRTLLSDGAKGLQRFIHGKETAPNTWDENGVKDIRLLFQTYSYAGN